MLYINACTNQLSLSCKTLYMELLLLYTNTNTNTNNYYYLNDQDRKLLRIQKIFGVMLLRMKTFP